MQIIDVKVNQVKAVLFLHHLFNQIDMMRQLIHAAAVQTQCLRAARHQSRRRQRIATGKQCDVMPHRDQFFC